MTPNARFELTCDSKVSATGETLYRVRSLVDRPGIGVRAGALGGWVAKAELIQGNAWVHGEAEVYGGAMVTDDAYVGGSAVVCGGAWLYGSTSVVDNAVVRGMCELRGAASFFGVTVVEMDGNVYLPRMPLWDAFIESSDDVVTVGPIGSEGVTAILHRTQGSYRLQVGCWEGPVDALMPEVERRRAKSLGPLGFGDCEKRWDLWLEEYRHFDAMCRRRIEYWSKL